MTDIVEPTQFSFDAESDAAIAPHLAKYPPGKQASAVLPLLDIAQRQMKRTTASAGCPPIEHAVARPPAPTPGAARDAADAAGGISNTRDSGPAPDAVARPVDFADAAPRPAESESGTPAAACSGCKLPWQ